MEELPLLDQELLEDTIIDLGGLVCMCSTMYYNTLVWCRRPEGHRGRCHRRVDGQLYQWWGSRNYKYHRSVDDD